MLKTFLATTAVVSLATLGAYAQDAPPADTDTITPGLEEPMAPANSPEAEADEPILPDAETAQEPAAPMPDATEEGAPMQAQEETTMPPAGAITGDEPPLEEGYTEVDVATLSADDLIGTTISTHDDQDVAEVNDVILSDDGKVENLVAEFGGFLGFGARTVLLTMDDINVLRDPNGDLVVRTDMMPEDLETRPDYEG